jgi:hypothetical protein
MHKDYKSWSPKDLFKDGARGSWFSEGVQKDSPEELDKDDQYYSNKYSEALNSIVKDSEWVDNEGEVFVVVDNTDEYGVTFETKVEGYKSSQSESNFLHTFKRLPNDS